MSDANSIRIAVVGHTNAGKTSLLRTLTRQASFGEVANRPGTTRHVERIALRVDGASAVLFFDTPGLEDSTALLDYLHGLGRDTTRLERLEGVEAFFAGPEARQSFEQEAKVLRTMLEVDAALYVIDCREPVLPKFRCEIEILASCGRPVMPVLNFVRPGPGQNPSREAEWQAVLSASGLHAQVRFDAVAPFVGSEQQLYQDLATLLPRRREALAAVVRHLDRELAERRAAACRLIAELLVDLAAMRRPIAPEAFADTDLRRRFVADFQALALAHVRGCMDALLQVYGFRREDADLAALPWLDGRWQDDLFHPETLKQAGKRLGQGAAIGASLGLIADIAVAGVSLGAGAVVGGAVGGMVTQGWRQFGNKLVNKLRGVQELTLENELLLVAAAHLIEVQRALVQRGHAAAQKLQVTADGDPGKAAVSDAALRQLVTAAQPARSHPRWERQPGDRRAEPPQRRALVEALAARLLALADTTRP